MLMPLTISMLLAMPLHFKMRTWRLHSALSPEVRAVPHLPTDQKIAKQCNHLIMVAIEESELGHG